MPSSGLNRKMSIAISLPSLRGSHNISRTLGKTRDMANKNKQNEYSCAHQLCMSAVECISNVVQPMAHPAKCPAPPATHGMLKPGIQFCLMSTTARAASEHTSLDQIGRVQPGSEHQPLQYSLATGPCSWPWSHCARLSATPSWSSCH